MACFHMPCASFFLFLLPSSLMNAFFLLCVTVICHFIQAKLWSAQGTITNYYQILVAVCHLIIYHFPSLGKTDNCLVLPPSFLRVRSQTGVLSWDTSQKLKKDSEAGVCFSNKKTTPLLFLKYTIPILSSIRYIPFPSALSHYIMGSDIHPLNLGIFHIFLQQPCLVTTPSVPSGLPSPDGHSP